MAREGVDFLLVSPSSDMVYLAGCHLAPSERPALLILAPAGPPTLLVPALELPSLAGLAEPFVVRGWGEADDPLVQLRELLGKVGSRCVLAISDQLWASFLLRLQASLPKARFIPASKLLRGLRMVKSAEEIALLKEAAARADRVFQQVLSNGVAGLTEKGLSTRIASLMLQEGFDQVEFRIVAAGENGASPHHFPTERRLGPGDGVVLDFGGAYGGYYADLSRTICVGQPGSELRRVYEVVREAQEAGVQAVRPGTSAEEVDRAAREVIVGAGYGEYFIHRTGHGIGLDVHEEPYIGRGSATALEVGMTFTVEPGIYIPGRLGVRIEDVVLVTEEGAQRLNQSPRELIVL
jgi:D-alanyl-D-alanine dipeptidase